MRSRATWLSAVIVAVALEFALAGIASAQATTTVDVRNFEVISVDGNKLVVRNEKGTHEYTVPDDFRFTVDGKQLSVLRPPLLSRAPRRPHRDPTSDPAWD